jgi:hypothetical protein
MHQSASSQVSTSNKFDGWLKDQILKLSVDVLRAGVMTCTACPESKIGEYIIEYQGESLRYNPEKTFAFLKFVTDEMIISPSVLGKSHG